MKNILILLIFIYPAILFSQTIFLETFNEGDGSTSGNDDVGGVSWSTTCPYSIASTDYFKIVNGVLEGRDTNGPAEFVTDEINTSSCTNTLLIEMDLSHTSTMEIDGGCNSVDIIKLEYSTDGGNNWNVVSDILQGGTSVVDTVIYSTSSCVNEDVIGPFIVVGGFSDFTYTACIYTTPSLKLKISVMNWADAEKYRIDNLKVSCSSCITPLPIELLYFTGEYNVNNGFDELKWLTASESNNDRFEIYSSIDGEYWDFVGQVDGAGNSTETISYYYNNKTSSTLVYYRLKQIDYNGDFEYSDIIPIRKDFESPISIRYYDLLGKELKSEPNTGHFIQVISYKYRTEYNRVYKI
jgi:hypothetical protein